MSGIITYSHIDNNKNMKISTHAIDSLDSYLKFVLANKEYLVWANLTDLINGDIVEQYINIKNYQNSGLDNAQLSLKGANAYIYKRVYLIHKLEFQNVFDFIKESNKAFYDKLVETKAFKIMPLTHFFKSKVSSQFYIFPADIYDVTMGEFTLNLNVAELSDFQEMIPIAKEIFIEIEESEETPSIAWLF